MTTDPAVAETSLEFTEELKGHVTFGELDFERGEKDGKQSGTSLMFHLTIHVDDVDRFIADLEHPASAKGWVRCDQLGGELPVEAGWFNLFVQSADPDVTNMLYRLHLRDEAGNPLTLAGFKIIRDDPGFDVWSDTTTLYVRLLRGHVDAAAEAGAEVTAAGIIHIHKLDFAKQLTTFRVHGPSATARAKALGDFGHLFAGKLWEIYRGKAEGTLSGEDETDG